jgi:hypothetical protein
MLRNKLGKDEATHLRTSHESLKGTGYGNSGALKEL